MLAPMQDTTRWQAWLERHQAMLYFVAVLVGVAAGLAAPGLATLSGLVEPALALMLYATFLQLPIAGWRAALGERRFLGAVLFANFLVVPALVAALLPWLPPEPWLRAGVALVLLAPCIDYVVTFAFLGRADARALLAATPLLLFAQMLLLPVYVPWLSGDEMFDGMSPAPLARAFGLLIVAPLLLAWATQRAWRRRANPRAEALLRGLPVPATALLLWLVAATILPGVVPAWPLIWPALPVYVAYAVLAPACGWGVARVAKLPPATGRAVAFSTGTRNSLVVLPLALAVPGALPVLPAVLILQTLVELLAQLVYIRWIARWGAGARARLAGR